MNIGEALKNYRVGKNLSRNQMQEITGVNFRYLGQIERGESNPSFETLYKISSAFNITISELIGETPSSLTSEQKALLDAARNLTPEQLELFTKVFNTIK